MLFPALFTGVSTSGGSDGRSSNFQPTNLFLAGILIATFIGLKMARGRLNQRRRRSTAIVPALSSRSTSATITLRSYWAVTKATTFFALVGSDFLVADHPVNKAFGEMRLHWCNLRYVPNCSANEGGMYAASVGELGDAKEFTAITSSGGSVVRRMPQPCVLRWRPTGPDDTNWYTINNKHTFFRVHIAALSGNIEGIIVIDTRATFRDAASMATIRTDMPHSSGETFDLHSRISDLESQLRDLRVVSGDAVFVTEK